MLNCDPRLGSLFIKSILEPAILVVSSEFSAVFFFCVDLYQRRNSEVKPKETHFEFCILQASKFVISEIHTILPRFLKNCDADQLASKCLLLLVTGQRCVLKNYMP